MKYHQCILFVQNQTKVKHLCAPLKQIMLDLPDTCNLIHTQDSWEEHTNITLGALAVLDGCWLWVTVFLENYKPLWTLCDTAAYMCARHSLVYEA